MALVVLAWVLYYFVNINLTNYNTKPVKAQLKQIVDVTQRHLILFPGILLQGAAIAALVPILPKYATQVVKVSTVEYTVAIIIGGICYFYQKSSTIIAKGLCMELFNSVQGFGSMIGPLVGGLITQFTNNLNNTFYFSAMIFLALAVFYGYYFIKTNRRVKP